MTDDQVDGAVRTTRLERLHRGVYGVGPTRSPGALELAAVMACSPHAYVSRTSAAHLYRLPVRALTDDVDVTVVGRALRTQSGIRVHRVRVIHPSEIGALDGIPITSPARTLLDLAATTLTHELEQLVAEAYALRLCTDRDLSAVTERHRGRPGAPALGVIRKDAPAGFTRSEAERRFLALLRRADLPPPHVNAAVLGYEVDFLWPRERVIVEVDGHAFHAARPKRERDARRDQKLIAAGYVVLRVTWRQIVAEPESLIARLAAALVRAAAGGDPRLSPWLLSSGGRPRPS